MQKWDYFTAYCHFEEKCKLCLDERKKPRSHWVINIYDNKHYWIEEGLKVMGAQGWELVGIQQTWQAYGGTGGASYLPHWYIFKKPIEA